MDTVVRQFNDVEATAFRLYDMAYFDFLYFHTGGMLPKTYVSIIPMITERGRKVYVNFRSDSENRCLFGNDVEYSFGENDQMIARIKAHKNSTEFWATGKGGENQYYGPWFHNHQMDKLEGISVADIATIYLYNARFRWKRFLFKDSRYIYEFQPDKPSLHRYTHAQFDDLNSTTTN